MVLVLFPDSNLRTAKLRHRAGHASRVKVPLASAEGRQSGLLTDSVVMTDNLATISDSEIDRVVGSLPMGEVEAALRHTLAL